MPIRCRAQFTLNPFAGGAGAGLKLLEAGHVDRVVINEADRAIFCLWWSVMHRTDAFIDRVLATPLTVKKWRRQRETYLTRRRGPRIDLGFATFYLKRGNRSGIVKDGGTDGRHQTIR
jgi:DNA adenine methylase